MDQYTELKQQLLERKHYLEERLQETDEYGLNRPFADDLASGELSQYDNHPADSGTELYEREKDLALGYKSREEIKDINIALQKFENGTYGICEVTGKQIPYERLEALPTARTIKEASPNQHTSTLDRPIEEDVLSDMEKQYYTGSVETEYNEENAYQIVASFNENSMTFEDSSLIDNEDGVGYVEPYEAFASTDMYGYSGDENIHFERNIQYDQWMNQQNVNEETLFDNEENIFDNQQ
ncbi:TraR/DksA C4-type zinc finger protein [Bacillus taeanensis]|uniref:Transcriptional regulator n=1 Tax=Bacillus taeanensis TaxID=273032 RepID=A0A366XT74_9BACI|nr:TraR/DksA C4-type zinc finger protein [Bacillus taeanensis]RBW67354.1 transcriptional regulator [Bacillus taeanensis]